MADYSKWMGTLKPIIGDVPINQIPIPGSHDSGTYGMDDRRAVTQGLSIVEQLSRGIRYFDLRPRQHDRRFYIHHTLGSDNHIATYPEHGFPSGMDVDALQDADGKDIIFAQMRKFLRDNPDEVLILRFQNFSDFSVYTDGTNDFQRFALLANAYFYINPASNNGHGCQLAPYAPIADVRTTFRSMTLNTLKNNNTRVIIFFANDEVQARFKDIELALATLPPLQRPSYPQGTFTFDHGGSNIWPTQGPQRLFHEPYWNEAHSWTADDDAKSVEATWYPYHLKNIHEWDVSGFHVLQSQMEELSPTPPSTSPGYHSRFISEQSAEYTYYMIKDAQGNLISNNGRNADRYIEWMKAGMTINIITFDFVQYGDLISKIITMYQGSTDHLKRQLYFASPGSKPWRIYPRTMSPTATMNANPWYHLIRDATEFPYTATGTIMPNNLAAPASWDFFTYVSDAGTQPPNVPYFHNTYLNDTWGICGHSTDGSFQTDPSATYYRPNINTYERPKP